MKIRNLAQAFKCSRPNPFRAERKETMKVHVNNLLKSLKHIHHEPYIYFRKKSPFERDFTKTIILTKKTQKYFNNGEIEKAKILDKKLRYQLKKLSNNLPAPFIPSDLKIAKFEQQKISDLLGKMKISRY